MAKKSETIGKGKKKSKIATDVKSVSRSMALSGIGRKKIEFISLTRAPLTYVVIPIPLPAAPTGANLNRFLDGVQRGFTTSPAATLSEMPCSTWLLP